MIMTTEVTASVMIGPVLPDSAHGWRTSEHSPAEVDAFLRDRDGRAR
jgi:hypothetical protein